MVHESIISEIIEEVKDLIFPLVVFFNLQQTIIPSQRNDLTEIELLYNPTI